MSRDTCARCPETSHRSGRGDLNPRPPAPKAGALPLRHSPDVPPASVPEAQRHQVRTALEGWARAGVAGTIVGAETGPRYTHASVKTTVAPLEGNKVRLSVEVGEDEFDKAVNEAFRKIAREVRIPGFRPGKAPRKILERRLGPQVGREQALHDALPEYYAQALSDNDVDAIDAPHIDITSGEEDGPVLFDAVVEVRPVVQVPGYGGLRVEIPRPEPSDEEIDAQVD